MPTFYAAKWREEEPTASNCEWFTCKRDAEREAARNRGRVITYEISTKKADILAFLNANVWRL